MKTDLIMAKVSFLRGVLDPDWVDGGPGQPGPIFSPAIADLAVAELLVRISENLTHREFSRKLREISEELIEDSSHRLSMDWDGDLCPPWPRPFPVGGPKTDPEPEPWLVLDPQPQPWLQRTTPAMNQIVLAHAIRDLASLTTSKAASVAIREVGEGLVKGASSALFDEYCGTPVKPHVPKPGRKAIAV